MAWRLAVRAEVVVAAAAPGRLSRVRHLAPRAIRHQEDVEVPGYSEGIARMDLPAPRRCVLIAAADFRWGRDGAGALFSVPAGGEQAITAEFRNLASADQVVLALEEGRDGCKEDGKLGGHGGKVIAARISDPVPEMGQVRAGGRDSALAEVGQCDLAAAKNFASVAHVDSAQAPDGVEVRDLAPEEAGEWIPTESWIKSKVD